MTCWNFVSEPELSNRLRIQRRTFIWERDSKRRYCLSSGDQKQGRLKNLAFALGGLARDAECTDYWLWQKHSSATLCLCVSAKICCSQSSRPRPQLQAELCLIFEISFNFSEAAPIFLTVRTAEKTQPEIWIAALGPTKASVLLPWFFFFSFLIWKKENWQDMV